MCRNIHNNNTSYTGANYSNHNKDIGYLKLDKDKTSSSLSNEDIESKETNDIDEITIESPKISSPKSQDLILNKNDIKSFISKPASPKNDLSSTSPISITGIYFTNNFNLYLLFNIYIFIIKNIDSEEKSPNVARIDPNQFTDQDNNEEFMKEGEKLLLHYLNTAPKVWLLLLKIPEFDNIDKNDENDNVVDTDIVKFKPLSTILADKIADLRLEEEFTSINQLKKLGINYDNTSNNLILLNINNETFLQYQRYYQHDLDVMKQIAQRKIFHQVNLKIIKLNYTLIIIILYFNI